MNKIKKVLICGLGAIGSIYATKIFDAENIELKILVDETRLKKYKKEPLIFNEQEYNFDYITNSKKEFVADLVIIATKNNTFKIAINQIKNFMHKDTIFLSLLNGLESEDILIEKFGKENVLYSYYIGHTSTRNDRKITHDGIYTTVFGEKENNKLSKNVLLVKDFFEQTKINYEIPKDMDYARWWKFLVNVGYNQASAILNANYGIFQTKQTANDYAINLMKEAKEIAKAEGVKNTERMIPEVLDVIKTMLPETRTSMLQDIDAKRQTEVDVFAGYITKLGKKHNIKTPYNTEALNIIKSIDKENYKQTQLL